MSTFSVIVALDILSSTVKEFDTTMKELLVISMLYVTSYDLIYR